MRRFLETTSAVLFSAAVALSMLGTAVFADGEVDPVPGLIVPKDCSACLTAVKTGQTQECILKTSGDCSRGGQQCVKDTTITTGSCDTSCYCNLDNLGTACPCN